jgi:hypothetical protein
MEPWITKMLEQGGLWALVFFSLIMLFKGVAWLGAKIVLPWSDKGLTHLATVDQHISEQTGALVDLRQQMKDSHTELLARLDCLDERVERLECSRPVKST